VRPTGWTSSTRWSAGGAIDSEQTACLALPVVEPTVEGARALGARYWVELGRLARGIVRPVVGSAGVELRLLSRRGPRLLVLGPPELSASGDTVASRFPIVGGVLTRRPGGALTLSQAGEGEVEVRVSVNGYLPVLGRGPGRRALFYVLTQARLHDLVSRRFFNGLIAAARS
jgi:hypothetical protein